MSLDIKSLQQWIGKEQQQADLVTLFPMGALAATLNRNDVEFSTGSTLPPLWHWLYFLSPARQSSLAADGHLEKGGFLPPVPLPRRMWAGSRLIFNHPVRAGQMVSRLSTIESIAVKKGRSGQLVFVRVRHEISNNAGMAMVELQDIVYRNKPGESERTQKLPDGIPAPKQAAFSRIIIADPVLMFRYSALTFNGHRIHYDRDYAAVVEGYPGLIVHGPLLATMLIELMQDELAPSVLKIFEFKSMRPVFDINSFTLCARQENTSVVKLWVEDHEGFLCMEATAEIETNISEE